MNCPKKLSIKYNLGPPPQSLPSYEGVGISGARIFFFQIFVNRFNEEAHFKYWKYVQLSPFWIGKGLGINVVLEKHMIPFFEVKLPDIIPKIIYGTTSVKKKISIETCATFSSYVLTDPLTYDTESNILITFLGVCVRPFQIDFMFLVRWRVGFWSFCKNKKTKNCLISGKILFEESCLSNVIIEDFVCQQYATNFNSFHPWLSMPFFCNHITLQVILKSILYT